MLLFIGLVCWAFSRRRHKDFEAAARLPLDDDRRPDTVGRWTEKD
jgi:cbb3-type cytochrome oxidase subunit 3